MLQLSDVMERCRVPEYDGDTVKLQYFRLFISNYKTLVFWGLFVCFGGLV